MWHKQSFTQFWSQSDAYSRRSSLKLTYIHHPLVVCTHQICCAVAVPIALSQDRLLHGHNRLVNWTPCSRMRESKLIKIIIKVTHYTQNVQSKILKFPLKLNTGALPLSNTAPAKMVFNIFCSPWLLTTIVILPGLPPLLLLLLTAKSSDSSPVGLTVSCPNCLPEVDATRLLVTFACDVLAGRETCRPEVDGTGLSGCEARYTPNVTVINAAPTQHTYCCYPEAMVDVLPEQLCFLRDDFNEIGITVFANWTSHIPNPSFLEVTIWLLEKSFTTTVLVWQVGSEAF